MFRLPFAHRNRIAVALILTNTACGHIGLDTLAEEGSSGPFEKGDSKGDPGSARDVATGGTASAVRKNIGGADASGGDTRVGGTSTGGRDGTGSQSSVPTEPCLFTCDEPYLLYRNFELEGDLGSHTSGGGVTVRSTEQVLAGEQSLRVSQGTPGSEAEMSDEIRLTTSGTIYFRAWVYAPAGAVNDWLKLFAANADTTPGIDVNLHADGSIEVDSQTGFQSARSEPDVVPLDQWFCFEVDTTVSPFSGSVAVRVNETTVAMIDGINSSPEGGIQRLVYGMGTTGPFQTNATMYWDEVVASTEPVPCE